MRIFLRQFKSPLIWILLIAAAITGFILKELVDTAVILLTVVVNTLLGFWQEYRADRALREISKLLTTKVKVIREGKRQEVDKDDLILGDIVVLEIGRIAPADGVLIEGDSMAMNEAILTGESMPVLKGSADNIFAGTSVASGIGQMRVEKLGKDTRIGQIAHTLGETKDPLTPLQKQVMGLAKLISFTILSLAVLIFILGAAQGKPIPLIFKLVVAMAVGAIPEGLVINLTVLLALGMKRIAKFKILVKNLIAAETLGNVTTLCLDKTGTLTEGKMRVISAIPASNSLIEAAILCNDLRDPLEIAMDAYAREELGKEKTAELIKEYPRSDEIPFSPDYKYIATLHPAKKILLVSGAPEVLLEKSDLSGADKQKWKEKFDKYASGGSRLVSFAYKVHKNYKDYKLRDSDINDLTWLGIIIFEDPIRESAAQSLVYAQKIGLKIHVITGDHLATTEAVIRKLQRTITDSQRFTSSVILRSESASDEGSSASDTNNLDRPQRPRFFGETPQNDIIIHARVSPEEKLDIVKKLQEQGEVVAMIGDGVNDALALKKADIGIVMGESSDVARETADLILLTNDFAGIALAIREGRSILANFRNIISYLLSHSLAEVILVGGGIFLPIPLPILATQILWTNMIADSLPGLALAFQKPDKKYRPVMKKLFTPEVLAVIFSASLLVGPLALGGFMYSWRAGVGVEIARSIAFIMLGAGSLFYALLLGSRKNIWLWIAIIIGVSLIFAPIYMRWGQMALELRPLSMWQVAATLLTSGFIMLVVGITKRMAKNDI